MWGCCFTLGIAEIGAPDRPALFSYPDPNRLGSVFLFTSRNADVYAPMDKSNLILYDMLRENVEPCEVRGSASRL